MSIGHNTVINAADLARMGAGSSTRIQENASAAASSSTNKNTAKKKPIATAAAGSSSSSSECPLSNLLSSLAKTSEEKKRLSSLNADWFNVALKGDKQGSAASKALRLVAKRRRLLKAKKVLESSAAVIGERQQVSKAVDRLAHRMGEGMARTPSTPVGPAVGFPSPTAAGAASPSTSTVAAPLTAPPPMNFNAVLYAPFDANKSKRTLNQWSKKASLKAARSAIVRKLAIKGGLLPKMRRPGARTSATMATSPMMKHTIGVLATAMAATRKAFVDRLVGQRLPSTIPLASASVTLASPTAAAASVASPTTASASGVMSPSSSSAAAQRVDAALAQSIAAACLPMIGATVGIAEGVGPSSASSSSSKGKKSAKKAGSSSTRKAAVGGAKRRSPFIGRKGVVLHQTARRAVVALERVGGGPSLAGGAACGGGGPLFASAYSGRVVIVPRSALRLA